MLEYLHLEKGDRPKTKDIFEGVDMTWGREPASSKLSKQIESLIISYEPASPSNSIPALLRLHQSLTGLVPPGLGPGFRSGYCSRSVTPLLRWHLGSIDTPLRNNAKQRQHLKCRS